MTKETITIKDIARMCGCGVSTVSRALNNHTDINPDTKEAILKCIKETGFVPNSMARGLKRTETKAIAVLIKGITNPFFTGMIKVIEAEVERRDYEMILHSIESGSDGVEVAAELVREKKVQGIIFLGGRFEDSGDDLKKLQVPYIFSTVGTKPENLDKSMYSSVAVDDVAESYKIITYLLEQGHEKIAILTDTSMRKSSVGNLRVEGYKKAFFDKGKEVDESLIFYISDYVETDEFFSLKNAYTVIKEKLMDERFAQDRFTALFCISDLLAIGAMKAIREAGLSIPGDMSVIGFDGLEMMDYVSPTVTTLVQPTALMAKATVELLFDVMTGQGGNEHLVFPGELMIKESTVHCGDGSNNV